MSKWKEIPLGEVLTLKRGYDLPNTERRKGKIPVVSSSGISDFHDECKAKGPGVVTGRYGTIGQVFYVPNDYWPLNTTLYVKDFKGNDPRFLSYFLQTIDFQAFAAKSAVPGINRNDLHMLDVNIPDIETQICIAKILSAYDDLIENNARRIAILEESAQRLYREWFVHFRFPGHEKIKMVDSEIGLVPKGWNIAPINDSIKTARKTIRRNELPDDMLYVGIEHIPRKKMIVAECSTASTVKSDKLLFSSGDVLFGKIRAYFHKIAIAPFDGCCSTDIIVMQLSTRRYAFDYLTLFSDDFIAYATQISQGTKMPRAEWNVLKEYKCVSPAQSVIDPFNQIIFPMIEEMQILTRKNANLRRTRDLLLPQLISGRLDVSELDIKVA